MAQPAPVTPRELPPSEGERRAFARQWHDELRGEISVAQDRRELVLRWSLPVAFAVVSSSATAKSPGASAALWHWLAGGVVLLVAVETTYRLTRDIIYAGGRNERLEKFDRSLPPFELAVHEPAQEKYDRLSLPAGLKKYWPRRGRSRVLAAWYATAAAAMTVYWFLVISGKSWEQSVAANTLPLIVLVGCLRLALSGRHHWRRSELLRDDRVLRWVETGE